MAVTGFDEEFHSTSTGLAQPGTPQGKADRQKLADVKLKKKGIFEDK